MVAPTIYDFIRGVVLGSYNLPVKYARLSGIMVQKAELSRQKISNVLLKIIESNRIVLLTMRKAEARRRSIHGLKHLMNLSEDFDQQHCR